MSSETGFDPGLYERFPTKARPDSEVEELKRIEAYDWCCFRADRVVHGRETRWVIGAVQRFEIKLAQVDAVPVEGLQQPFDAGLDGCGAGWGREVDQLTPVELGLLQGGRFFAALRTLLPEALTDMRQLQPGVNQYALAPTSLDQPT